MSKIVISNKRIQQIVKEELVLRQHNQKLNEGFSDFLGSLFGSGTAALVDRLKNYVATWILRTLGFDTNSIFSQAVINVFENLSAEEMLAIISGDRERCPAIAREVFEAIGETLLERLPELVGVQADGIMAGTFREMATNAIIRNNSLIQQLTNSICNMDISNVLSAAGASPEKAAAAETSLEESRVYSKNQVAQIQYANKRLNQLLSENKATVRRRKA